MESGKRGRLDNQKECRKTGHTWTKQLKKRPRKRQERDMDKLEGMGWKYLYLLQTVHICSKPGMGPKISKAHDSSAVSKPLKLTKSVSSPSPLLVHIQDDNLIIHSPQVADICQGTNSTEDSHKPILQDYH